MNIIDHVEHYLGQMDHGWKPTGSPEGVSVSRFCDQPVEGMSTFVTFGLSSHRLSMSDKREVRQELISTNIKSVSSDGPVSFLLNVADSILFNHEALLRGQVIEPGRSIFTDSPMNAVYVSIPVLFDEGLYTFKETSPPTVLAWLIPIYANEAKYIKEHGWDNFEDILERKDPDLWDLERPPVVSAPN